MHPRASELISILGLESHPEGGYFAQVYRSSASVSPDDDRDSRPALTTIYFLLVRGAVSAWHRVRSDEVWHYYEGDPLALTFTDTEGATATTQVLGPVAGDQRPVAVVPADCWQTARSLGDYTLIGATVGPGFDYADFELSEPPAMGPTAHGLWSRRPRSRPAYPPGMGRWLCPRHVASARIPPPLLTNIKSWFRIIYTTATGR